MKVPKQVEQQIKECVKRLSEDEIKFIAPRINQRFGGDLGEALEFIYDKCPDLNKIFSSTVCSDDIYDIADVLNRVIQERIKG